MHRTALAASVAVLLVLIAGCGSTGRGQVDSGDLQAQWVDLPDGRVVICVHSDPWQSIAGVTCDWGTAALEGEQP